MFKSKGKVVSLLTACLTLLFALVLGFTALFAPTPITTADAATTTVTDTLNRAWTGVEAKSTYATWSNKTGSSGVVYAGQSAGDKDSIQLRSSNNNSGIVTTGNPNGAKAKKITITWNTGTTNGRILNIYGKNSAYTQATDLYNDTNRGTSLGSIKYGTSTELEIKGDYQFIGMRSSSGAMYISEIKIDWEIQSGSACEHSETYYKYEDRLLRDL